MFRGLKIAAFRLAKQTGITSWVSNSAWRRRRLLILCYHGVSFDDEHLWRPGLYIPAEQFRARMKAVVDAGCNVLPLGEALDRLHAGTLPPRAVALTFDDGTYDFFRLACPILKEFRLPVTVYVPSYYAEYNRPVFDVMCSYLLWKSRGRTIDWPGVLPSAISLDENGIEKASIAIRDHADLAKLSGRDKDGLLAMLANKLNIDYESLCAKRILCVMTPEEVAEAAAAGVDIQLHTHRHRTPVNRELFVREITDNRERIEKWSGIPARHFCYPSGVYVPEFFGWLRECEVESATTCEPGFCTQSANPFALPRLLDSCWLTSTEFETWLSGLAALVRRRSESGEAH